MKPTYSVEEFRNRVIYYFKDCEETRNTLPDEAGLINFVFRDSPDYVDEEEEFRQLQEIPAYAKIIRWARRRRTSYLERSMVSNPRVANGCMNALKQAQNGGYSDRPQEKKGKQLIVKLGILGENEK